MLIDTGCNLTMVSANQVDPKAVDYGATEAVACVHGDTAPYPMVTVRLQLGDWKRLTKVAVVPTLPVPVLL